MSAHSRRAGRRAGRERGLATVEFAIGVPVILLLMLAAAEIGRVYYSQHELAKAVRSGSRYLSTVALNAASVMDLNDEKLSRTRDLVLEGAAGPVLEGLSRANVTIAPLVADGSGARHVEVRATYDYRPLLGALPGLGGTSGFGVPLSASSVMRVVR